MRRLRKISCDVRWPGCLTRILLLSLAMAGTLILHAQINTAYFMTVGRQELSTGNNAAAIERFNVVISYEPQNPDAYLLRAIAKYNLGDLLGAERDLSATISLHPLLSYAYHYRAVIRDRLQDYYNALRDLDRALELDPYEAEYYVTRGVVKLHMQSYLWSLNDFDSAIRIDPKNIQAYSNRAVARATLMNFQGALADCNKAVQLDPFNAEVYLKRGVIKADMEDHQGARDDLTYSIKLKDDLPYTWFNRALANIHLGDTLIAIGDFNKVLELDPYNALTFYNRALLRSQAGDLYGALEDYNKVLLLNPENIYTYYNRAVIRHYLEDYAGAAADYTKAIELFPDFAGAYLNRSDARRQAGDDKGAYLDYQKAVSIINRVNTVSLDSIRVKEYADSAYFSKIIEFEADFVALSMKEDFEPDRSVDLVDGFRVQFTPDDYFFVEKVRAGYMSPQLEDINRNCPIRSRMIFANSPVMLGQALSSELALKADSLVAGDPYSAWMRFMRGVINSMLGNFQSALQDYDRAIELDPTFGLAYLNRAWLLFEMAERSSFESKYSTPVTITWGEQKEAVEASPPASPDYSRATGDLEKAIRLLPGLAFPLLNHGNLRVRMKDYSGAVTDYSAAIEAAPGLPEAWFNRALTLIYLNNAPQACLDLSKAGERGLPDAYRVIGRYCKN